MRRRLTLYGFIAVAGCSASAPQSDSALSSVEGDIDFVSWPSATSDARPINPIMDMTCEGANAEFKALMRAEEKRRGPHYQPAVIIRTNPEAITNFKAGRSPMPAGTVVVKEKHQTEFAWDPPDEYGAMVKREAGYDPDHGDWEYLYVVRSPEKKVSRGRMQSCIDCHSIAKDTDYLFRTYLPDRP
jgi:hypothetical protein